MSPHFLASLTDAELTALFWATQRACLATISSADFEAYSAACDRKFAVLTEQRARRAAKRAARVA